MRVVVVPLLLLPAAAANSAQFRGTHGIPDFDDVSNVYFDGGDEKGNQSENDTVTEELYVTTTSPTLSSTFTTTTKTRTTTVSTTPATTSTTVTSTTTHFTDAVLAQNWLSTLCATTQHVICDEDLCEKQSDGMAACNCRKEAATSSILPSEVAGAPALTGSLNYGLSMCFQMNSGTLYSAFSPSTIPFGTMKLAKCPQNKIARTEHAICWGAPCEANLTHPDRATCQCPIQTATTMPVLMDRFLVAPSRDCDVVVPSTCEKLSASGRDWMATVIGAFAPEPYLNNIACNWNP